ncbi:MAG: hypothetical protein LRS48_04995 [Desulfurococcales archaeon]|nr:hypothetical protein [Desulfurococcales archaeon]
MEGKIRVRVRYPPGLRGRAESVALLFHHPLVEVELVEDGGEDIVVEGPGWATGDLTLATILARRELAWRKKLNIKNRR